MALWIVHINAGSTCTIGLICFNCLPDRNSQSMNSPAALSAHRYLLWAEIVKLVMIVPLILDWIARAGFIRTGCARAVPDCAMAAPATKSAAPRDNVLMLLTIKLWKIMALEPYFI